MKVSPHTRELGAETHCGIDGISPDVVFIKSLFNLIEIQIYFSRETSPRGTDEPIGFPMIKLYLVVGNVFPFFPTVDISTTLKSQTICGNLNFGIKASSHQDTTGTVKSSLLSLLVLLSFVSRPLGHSKTPLGFITYPQPLSRAYRHVRFPDSCAHSAVLCLHLVAGGRRHTGSRINIYKAVHCACVALRSLVCATETKTMTSLLLTICHSAWILLGIIWV